MELQPQKRSRAPAILVVTGLLLVANSAYLAAFGDPTLFYVFNALLHPVLGVVATALFLRFLYRNLTDPQSPVFLQGGVPVGIVALLISAALGVYLLFVGMTRPHSRALYLHVSLAVLGLFPLLAQLKRLRQRIGGSAIAAWRWTLGVVVGSAVFYAAVASYHHFLPNPRYQVHNPPAPPLSAEQEGAGPNGLMFPSSARTADGQPIKPEFFMNSETCKKCHADIYQQWYSSMHHFASFNNQWYRKSIEYMQDTIGVKSSLWCGGCHDHAVAFSGLMQKQQIREIVHTPEAQAGLGCMSCHAIVHVNDTMGQGGFVIEYPALDRLASSTNPVLRWLHDFAVKLNPKPHRSVFLKPFHKESGEVAGFCSACHKVHLDVPVNNYRWIRGFNEYDNWQASGVSGQGARSFYYPPKSQNCADCHMPFVPSQDFGNIRGFVHSHRFAAANTAVPFSYGDQEQLREVKKFLEGTLSVDIFALAEEPQASQPSQGGAPGRPPGGTAETPQLASTFAVGEESAAGMGGAGGAVTLPLVRLVAPLGRVAAQVRRGDTVRVEVVVRTRKLGHFFPGGTVDAFDCWLELQAKDDKGRVIFWSGKAGDDGHGLPAEASAQAGPVEPGAHFYRSLQLDAHGNVINKRNAWATRAVMYAHLIPPGAADTAHFRMKVPEDCGDHITLEAKLNYRKFSWWNTHWAFAGIRDPNETPHPVTKDYDDGRWLFAGDLSQVSAKDKQIPDLPTVVIAENQVTVPVVAKAAPAFAEKLEFNSKDRERWNDYGIGLLLQGDLKGAERAFETVTRIDPGYADGWVNVARARVQEGNTEAAKPMLLKALELRPQLASAHYFYGLALKVDGKYRDAYGEFARAAALYPNDRVVRNQMGRMLFLQRRYREAVAEYQRTLSVDPEDLEAHYNLMLCYRGLGDDARAAHEEKLYLRFKADEAARAITGPFKLKHPEDNNEAQPIHEHLSVALEPACAGRPRGSEKPYLAHSVVSRPGGVSSK